MSKYKLPPEDIALLRKHQRELNDILSDLDEMEQCGIDCTAPHEVRKDVADKIEKLLQFYGGEAR